MPCLTKQITANVNEYKPDFEIPMTGLERLYTQAKAGCVHQYAMLKTDCIKRISQVLPSKKSELSKYSETRANFGRTRPTCRCWEFARELVEADRTGSWQMHLHAISDCLPMCSAPGHPNCIKSAYPYLQNMFTLESDKLSVFHKFVNGFHVIRRTGQY